MLMMLRASFQSNELETGHLSMLDHGWARRVRKQVPKKTAIKEVWTFSPKSSSKGSETLPTQ